MRVLFFLICCVLSFPALAQDALRLPPKVDFTFNKYSPFLTGPRYEDLVKKILAGQRSGFSFELLRIYYSTIDVYDPEAERAVKALLDASYNIAQAKTAPQKEIAVLDYRSVLYAHMGNMAVVEQALSLALQNADFGDADMLAWLLGGLRDSVLASGDGKDLSAAYVVYSVPEEAFVLNHLRAEILDTEKVSKGRRYYNIHNVYVPGHSAPYYLVFDVSRPAQFLEAQRR